MTQMESWIEKRFKESDGRVDELAIGILNRPLSVIRSPTIDLRDVLLLPWGVTELRDGTKLLVDEQAGISVVEEFEQHGVDIPFDINHSTVLQGARGEAAPAYGWGKDVIPRPGKGLFCQVEWTEEGLAEIKKGHYRYLSPVVGYEKKTGRVRLVHSVALVTKPATPRMPALAASDFFPLRKDGETMSGLLRKLLQDGEGTVATAEQKVGELKKVLEAKGVALGDEADFVAIINAAIAQLEGKKEEEGEAEAAPTVTPEETAVAASVRLELGLPRDADQGTVLKSLSALKGHIGYVSAAQHSKMTGRLETLEKENAQRKAEELVQGCLSEGKLLESDGKQLAWARTLAAKDPEGFKALMAGAPVIVPQGRTVAPNSPRPGIDQSGKEDEMIEKALSENNNNHGDALVSLQLGLMEEQRQNGLSNKAARQTCERLYPKIFMAA